MTADRRRALASTAVAFVSGGVLLGVELAASRVLAPFFGNSLFVWGALIGVVLTGLSVGYWLGGVIADRLPRASLVVAVLLLGGAAVLAIPVLDEPVLEWIVEWDPGPRADPLLAAVILFGPASVILASVTPIVVRLLMQSLATAGRTAGRLFSISTAGSIVGTFLTAFWLIPELGLDQLLALLAAALFAAATAFALVERLLPALAGAAVALAVAVFASISLAPSVGETLSSAQAQNWSPLYRLQKERGRSELFEVEPDSKLVYRKETRYHRLAVVDDSTSRFLRFDASYQSGMFLGQPFRTRFDYTDYFNLALAYRPSTSRMLFLGLGGASAPKRIWRDFPKLQIDVAELDPVVVDVAHRYFALPRSPRLNVDVEDARRYLAQRDDRRWDVINIDTFYSDSIPFHLTTREFLELVRDRLEPGGVVVTNVIGALEGPDSKLFRSLYRTYASVFPTVLVHPVVDVGGVTTVRNIMLVATDSPPVSKAFLRQRWNDIRREHPKAPSLAEAIADRRDVPVRTDDVPILTDDYAPTDALLYVG